MNQVQKAIGYAVATVVVTVMISPINLLVHAQTTEDDDEGWNDSCGEAGFNDGQNGPLNGETYDHCGDEATGDKAYLDGFIDGCMSVEGNTIDVCESATDG